MNLIENLKKELSKLKSDYRESALALKNKGEIQLKEAINSLNYLYNEISRSHKYNDEGGTSEYIDSIEVVFSYDDKFKDLIASKNIDLSNYDDVYFKDDKVIFNCDSDLGNDLLPEILSEEDVTLIYDFVYDISEKI